MRAVLSKLASFLSVPANGIATLAVIGLVLLLFNHRFGPAFAKVALAALALGALSPLGNILLTPLERSFPEGEYPSAEIEGIIVLGGSYDTQSHGYLSTIYLLEDTEPMAVIPDLARRFPKAKIIFSGGSDPSVNGPSEAGIVKNYFVSFGIAANRIAVEEKSLTTEENARFTAQMIRPAPESRWLLVTSAYHMPRAMATFKRAGFKVIAFPVGARTQGWHDMWRPASTATDNLRRLDIAVHEWIGLVFYRIRGYSNELLPGPPDHS